MNIVFDNREAQLYSRCAEMQVPNTSIEVLTIGDIAIRNAEGVDIVLIERKSLTDLIASIKDGRYEEQSHRLIHTSGLHPHNILYVIEGMFSQLRTPADKTMVISAMTSLQLYKGFSVIRTSSVNETADLIAGMAKKIKKNTDDGKPMFISTAPVVSGEAAPVDYTSFVKKTKRENITPENIGELMIAQIPGISSTIAAEIMRFAEGDMQNLIRIIREEPERLKTIEIKSGEKKRKIGKNVVESLITFLDH